jgi:hypothetical protein
MRFLKLLANGILPDGKCWIFWGGKFTVSLFLSFGLPLSREIKVWSRREEAAVRETRNESTATEAEHQNGQVTRVAPELASVHVIEFRAGPSSSWVVAVVHDVLKRCSVLPFTSLLGSQTPTLPVLSLPLIFSSSTPLYTIVYSSQPQLVTISPIAYLSAHLLEMDNRTS